MEGLTNMSSDVFIANITTLTVILLPQETNIQLWQRIGACNKVTVKVVLIGV